MARRLPALVVMSVAAALLVAGCSDDSPPLWNGPISTATRSGPSSAPPSVAPPPAVVGGVLFYIPSSGATQANLLAWSPGQPQAQKIIKMRLADAQANVTIAPDGQHIAWVQANDTGGGTLYVANPDGSSKKSLGQAEPYCVQPSWTSDAAHVVKGVQVSGVPSVALVDTESGASAPLPNSLSGCHVVFSGDGTTLAIADGAGRIELANVDGSNVRLVPKLGGDQGGPDRRRAFSPQSLSSDAKYIALPVHTGDTPDGDVGRSLSANEIVDTATGDTMTLPVAGTLDQALFLPGGGVIVRVKATTGMQVALLGPDFSLVAQEAELPALSKAVLFGFAGAE